MFQEPSLSGRQAVGSKVSSAIPKSGCVLHPRYRACLRNACGILGLYQGHGGEMCEFINALSMTADSNHVPATGDFSRQPKNNSIE